MRILCFFLIHVLALSANGQNNISAQVGGFENSKGLCRACLYNSSESFNGKGKAVQCTEVPITNQKATIVFQNVAAGTYAISLFHDANNNKKLDTNFLGIPKEGYGASQNDLPFAGAPTFNGNKFQVSSTSTNLSIRLRYIF